MQPHAVTHLTAVWTHLLHINTECLTSDLEPYCLELQKSGTCGEKSVSVRYAKQIKEIWLLK